MGYTNYTTNTPAKHPQTKWDMMVEAVKHVYSESDVRLTGEYAGSEPEFGKDVIFFYGDYGLSCEPMVVNRVMDKRDSDMMKRYNRKSFSFCKTQQHPYDLMVKATMLLHKYFFPEVEIACDGPMSEFDPAKFLVEQVTGLELPELKEEVEA